MNSSSDPTQDAVDSSPPVESDSPPTVASAGTDAPVEALPTDSAASNVVSPMNPVAKPVVEQPRPVVMIPAGWHSKSAAASNDDDLMQPLPEVKPGVFDRFRADDKLKIHLDELQNNRILIVTCLHGPVLADAAWLIAKHPQFAGHDKWLYEEKPERSETQDPIELSSLLSWHERRRDSREKLSFVHVVSRRLWGSVVASLKRDAFRRQSTLLKQSVASLVLLVHPDALPAEETTVSVPEIRVWEIPFLEPLLYARHQPGCAEPEQVLQDFELQQNHWPQEPRELYDDAIRFLGDTAEGFRRFQKELLDRPQRLDGNESIVPDLSHQTELHRAVLLTATFFPESTPQAFDCVLNVILSDIRHTVSELQNVPNPAGQIESRAVTREIAALDHWRRQKDNVARECGLKWQLDAQGQRVLDFIDPRVRSRLETLFHETQAGFVLQQFQRLYASGLLFAADTAVPRSVADRLVLIAGTIAAENRVAFGPGWLLDAVRAIETWYPDVRLDKDTETGVPHDVQLLSKFLELIAEKHGRTVFFYHRLSELCAELLRREATRPTVTSFLRMLLDGGDAASEILLRLVRRLKFRDGFDYFDWLRNVLDHAPLSVRIDVEQQLLRDAFEHPGGFEEVATHLSTWHPPLDQTESKTMSGQYALGFLLDFFVYSRNQFDAQARAQPNTARHPVFSGTETDRKTIEMLVSWMLHPALAHGLRRVVREFANAAEDDDFLCDPAWVISELIDDWTRMAEQLASEPLRQSCHQLVEAVRLRADRQLKTEINAIWRSRLEDCRSDLMRLGTSDREHRNRLKQARDRLMQLRQLLAIGSLESL